MNWHYHQIIRTTSAHIFLLCLFVLSFCVSSNVAKAVVAHRKNITCIGQERDALLKFKHHIEFDNCGLMSSWGNPNKPDCCTWKGVTCSNQSGHVIGLNLGDCLDSDQDFSPPLSELKHLKYLDLSSNYFYGMDIPTSIGSLVNLIHLNLSNSGFGGNIPNELGNLASLTSLDLSNNEWLSAKSLKWISRLSLLRDINLSGTNLTEATNWTQSIGSLPLLEVLQMDDCQLSTPLTTSSLLSPNLRIVSLTRNNLTSPSVFQWLFNSSNYSSHKQSLEYLDLSYNSLSSKIPDAIENIQSLKHMDLSYNSLSGSIPSTLGVSGASGICSLLYLDLSHNHLEDAIPNAMGNCHSISHIDLSSNQLQGSIPSSLGELSSLLYLDLSNNHLEDAIPNAMWNCHSIYHIDLSSNQLQGSIPSSLGELSSLLYLDLSNNHLEDTIPSSMAKLDYLEYLDLSCNNLRGAIPCQIGSNRALAYLNFSYNNLSGYIPKYYMRDFSFDPTEDFQGNPSLHTDDQFKGTCGEASILSGEQVEGDDENNKDKIYPGLYVSIGIGFYTGFWVFCGTLTLKNSWRHAYFRFLDSIIDNIYVTVAVFLARFRRNSHE